MKIAGFFNEQMICLDLKATGKNEAIEELGEYINKTNKVRDYKRFIREVKERDEMATTGIGNEIAIPHARTDTADNFIIVLGRSENGVDFGAFDNKPAKLIFLMAIPKREIDEYLIVLAHLTKMLKQEQLLRGLYAAKSGEEAVNLMKTAEN